MRLWVIGFLLFSSGCSWQGLVSDTAEQAHGWRVVHQNALDETFRWRLSTYSRLTIGRPQTSTQSALQPWTEAAQRGIERVFMANRAGLGGSHYTVLVDWPVLPEPKQASKKQGWSAAILGLNSLPALPRTGLLGVRVVDDRAMPIYQAELEIRPSLFSGRSWSDEAFIEAAFAELAQTLAGSG